MRHARDDTRDTRPAPSDTRLAVGRRVLAYTLLLTVLGAVAAMSWAGLYAFARGTLGWSPGHAILVPVSLDIAAMACATLALDSISRGETAFTFRALTGGLVALSAFINWRHAIATGNLGEQVFFPAMSVISYAMVHAVMGKAARETRRGLAGQRSRQALEPLPRTGIAVWLPGIGAPGRALGVIRAAIARRLPAEQLEHRDAAATVYLEGLTQTDAIRRAIETVGPKPREVVAWLDSNGWPDVAPQRVYDVIRRDQSRPLRAVDAPGDTENVS